MSLDTSVFADEDGFIQQSGFRILMDTEFSDGNAAAAVQWCLYPDTILRMQADGYNIEDAYVLVSISTSRYEEERYAFKATDVQGIVSFFKPGAAYVLGRLIWGPIGYVKGTADRFTQKSNRTMYEYETLRWDDDDVPTFAPVDDAQRLYGHMSEYKENLLDDPQHYEVEVEKEFFGKQLSPWHDWWINLWYKHKPTDQCDRRKRWPVAYIVKPVVIPVYLALRSAWLLMGLFWYAGLWGYRGYSLQPMIHPFTYKLQYATNGFELKDIGSLYSRDKNGTMRPYGHYVWPFLPGFLLIEMGILTFFISTWAVMLTALVIFATLLAIASIPVKVGTDEMTGKTVTEPLLPFAIAALYDRYEAWQSKRTQTRAAAEHEILLDELTCDAQSRLRRSSGVGSVRHRMLRHRAKNAVCKPLSR